MLRDLADTRIAVIGLGYVGLPLAVEFGKRFPTVGLDINSDRIRALQAGYDGTLEVTSEQLASSRHLELTSDPSSVATANTYIVTVPTPIDKYRRPDMTALLAASRLIGEVISPGDIVIYESTVYPGATEEVCIPAVEKASGLKYNEDFFAGYSPERINPGDKVHRLPDIIKVTSGSTPMAAEYVDALYGSIISAGTHRASSIRVAEAAKVIENTQRDLNIALVNELAMIFAELGLDTEEVLKAAGTKWNFLPFKPGLVGGHCIGVDPYYLTFKAQEIGYHPEIILAGRRVNDQMGDHIAQRVVKIMASSSISIVGARVLILGLAFKENCPDIRNTKVVDLVRSLSQYNAVTEVYDPWVDPEEAREEYEISLLSKLIPGTYDAVILAVAHREFVGMGATQIRALGKDKCVLFDVKHVLPKDAVEGRL